ncbi:MAG: hypothetical protein ACKV22_23180 [Bryobacteraceae bacterium]
MPQLQVADYRPPIGSNPIFDQNDEAVTSKVYGKDLLAKFEEIYKSAYWLTKARFVEARRRLSSTVTLGRDWNTYGEDGYASFRGRQKVSGGQQIRFKSVEDRPRQSTCQIVGRFGPSSKVLAVQRLRSTTPARLPQRRIRVAASPWLEN